MQNKNNLRKHLFRYLDDVLSVSHKKFDVNNKPDKERRAWGRILIQAISTYGKLLETLELTKLAEDIEKLKEALGYKEKMKL